MASIKLQKPVSKDETRAILARRCPDLDLGTLGPTITASSSPWVAAMISVDKRTISVAPMVANMKMLLLFVLIAFTGIGIVLYAVLAVPKQLQVARRVEAALAQELAGPGDTAHSRA